MVKPAAGRLDQMKKQIKTNNYEERNGVDSYIVFVLRYNKPPPP